MEAAVVRNNVGSFSADVKPPLGPTVAPHAAPARADTTNRPRQRPRRKNAAEEAADDPSKRRCVSTACVACRKRKSKCDGNLPACAACVQVYGTECIYSPESDHRRKGVYKNDVDNLKTRNSTLQTLVQAILNYAEDDIPELIREIRTCESLDTVAEKIVARENGSEVGDDEEDGGHERNAMQAPTFETQLYGKMGDLRLDDGSVRYFGGTSNLIHLAQDDANHDVDEYTQQEDPITSWTDVTDDPQLVLHLLNMYFTWHYAYFTTLSKTLFYRDFLLGRPPHTARRKTYYCSPLLVNAILAVGCHFTSHLGAREIPEDSGTAGDHFFKEAKRLIMENDEHEKPRLTTVQALALMSVREAGCGREAKGWVYSGMSFRMASDMGLNLDSGRLTSNKMVNGDEAEEDVRRVTFWGCFLFDKCWSNYLGRLPQLQSSTITVPKVEVFPDEDAAQWCPYTDSGFAQANAQPARTRAVALQITKLCEISNDLMRHFYDPTDMEKTKGKAAELKKLSDIHTRLESWRRELPKEFEPKEGCLASVLVMHMFFQLLFIHLFRPFLKYTQQTSPLPQNVSPRKLCTQAAGMISKLMRLYKRSHGLRQICNIVVYITHSACTIHLLNIPDKNACRDIVHGVKHLEEIAEGWPGARRTLSILSVLVRKWNIELPAEAAVVLARTDAKFGTYTGDIPSPPPTRQINEQIMQPVQYSQPPTFKQPATIPPPSGLNYVLNPSATATTNGLPLNSGGAAVSRPPSDTFALPPSDSHGVRAAPIPSATHTPTNRTHHSHRSRHSVTTTAASPSDMFGGVEQLLRDSQDWVYRDQAQFATGFGNWNGNGTEIDPAAWAGSGGGVVTGTPMTPVNLQTQAQAQAQVGSGGLGRMSTSPGFSSAGNGIPGAMMGVEGHGGFGVGGWLGGYDEGEWYL
ncbi:Nitrogen assimilation transcription factor nit-4 [Meristemomyces frigidus]|uniref:Nitrogen assimilation transcription factor nit-4 n=1 Tax=Meristemomyces frigidus TaxID=1508187 RepID=A0AAN7TPD7_9PEZI|nr:Nitrogen assimilation transcription factor nit-4 [Meristemomyces frigidus]